MNQYIQKARTYLSEPQDISGLIFFRLAFGAILLWEVCRYFQHGWIHRYWIGPDFFFTYDGFHWLEPWSGNGMYIHFMVLGILALFIMLGLFYRISASLFFLGFTYIFLLDKANYLNHFYLIALLSFLMIFLPTNRSFSLDAKIFPKIKSETTPRWAIYLLAFQLGIAYFFGGIAKINPDWLAGEPMRMWLAKETDFPIIGQFFKEEWMVYFFSYSGLFFDLLIVPLLIWRKTRIPAFLGAFLFHLINSKLFSIGIFPWFMMAATTIYFDPSWFRNLINKIPSLNWGTKNIQPSPQLISKKAFLFIGAFCLIQIGLPLRHFLIPGYVNWTEEGHRFSWHMKLRHKSANARFVVEDLDSGETFKINPKDYLSKRQRRKMSTRPDMIYQFSQYIEQVYQKKGYENIEIRAIVKARLNKRDRQYLVDSEINLSNRDDSAYPSNWIVELDEKSLFK